MTPPKHDRALLAAIIDSSDDAVISVDPAGLVTSWNRGAERLYGHTQHEAVGRPLAELVAFRNGMSADRWRRALAGEIVPAEEIGWRRDDVDLMLEESLSPVRTEEGDVVGAASIARDVTQRRRIADELAQVRRDLERNNARLERSNADLEQFAYVASHDLSEPLRAIAGMVSLLRRRYRGRLDPDADEYIDFAVDGCDRMRRMIDDVLLYARAGHGDEEREAVDAGAVAREVVSALRLAVEAAHAEVVIGDLPVIRMGRSDLHLLLQNLLSNAIKFRHPERPSRVEVTADHDGVEWTFCVLDNGLGVDPQFATRAFRMFQRLHPEVGADGTGIGLAIAERVVSGLGGRIWVEPRAGGGSRFCFTVPDLDGPD